MLDALAWIEGVLSGSDSDRVDRALLVAGEVLANAVEHRGENDALEMHISIRTTDRQLDMSIVEPSREVTLERLEAATLPEEALATSGRGLFLIRTLADEIATVGDSGTTYSFFEREMP